MKVGFIGLGRMGGNMARRLIKGGHEVVVHNRTPKKVKELEKEGAIGSVSMADFVVKLTTPRIIFISVPAGDPVTQTLEELIPQLAKGDMVIESGNSYYKDSIERGKLLKEKGINFLDMGTSGGIWGLEKGYCLMIGGEKGTFDQCEPLFKTLAPKDGYLYAGPFGAGHFVKMVHNGIEYGMLQAYGEGFDILKHSGFDLDLQKISHLWNQGSVVRSWLLELAESAFGKNPNLSGIQGYIADSGEGRWTVQEAIEKSVPAPVITLSLLARFQSRDQESFGAKVIAALRDEFGGHGFKKG